MKTGFSDPVIFFISSASGEEQNMLIYLLSVIYESPGLDRKLEREPKSMDINKTTEIYCPQCGKRSCIRIRWGQVIVYCKYCKKDFEVKIEMKRTLAQQQLCLNFE